MHFYLSVCPECLRWIRSPGPGFIIGENNKHVHRLAVFRGPGYGQRAVRTTATCLHQSSTTLPHLSLTSAAQTGSCHSYTRQNIFGFCCDFNQLFFLVHTYEVARFGFIIIQKENSGIENADRRKKWCSFSCMKY